MNSAAQTAGIVVLPAPVRAYLDRRLFHPQAVACLEMVDAERRWYGSLQRLGVRDTAWLDHLLVGLPADLEVCLPLVQSPEGVALEFHQIVCEGRRFLLLLASGEAFESLRQEQQQAHELALRNRQQDQVIRTLERAAELLVQSERELKRASRAQELVISAIAHEFGTPLTALLGHLELLSQQVLPETARQRLAAVRRGVGHLTTLVQGALDRNRLVRGDLRVVPIELPLAPLIADVVDLFGPQLTDRDIPVTVTVPAGIHVRSDPLRLRQVLINLLSNAIKYGAGGAGIRIIAEPFDQQVRLAVRDHGSGLSAIQQQKLFEPYERLHVQGVPGHGLGLWIVKELAQALGVGFGVRSPWDGQRGAEFWLLLPAAGVPVTLSARAGQLAGYHALLVDDDDEVRELVAALLAAQGAQVIALPGLGAEAAHEMASHIDSALIDLELGAQGSGLQAIRALRQAGFNGRIVAASANDEQPVAARAVAAGATAFIGKPFDFEQLFGMLDGNVA